MKNDLKELSVWRTAVGEEILVQDMSDEHLQNAIHFMRKRYKSMFANKSAAALAIWWKDFTLGRIDESIRSQWPIFGELLEEAVRRGFDY